MKILLDEGVPRALRRSLSPHQVDTTRDRGWDSIQNGKLLALVEQGEYEVFITADKNMSFQQTLTNRVFASLVLSTNHWPTLTEHTQVVAEAVLDAVPGEVVQVECGRFPPDKNHTLEQS